ncbi:sorbosone dehydrogenase family protein [Luteimonas sp. BDR2-5]|uniref:PQQ-dependent sugar dehydrogenase n=1 Tax=Proluteimonas luteida TaxID=2878685 RepID=UPI001E344B3C|nr:sorbosone dehydrogenase family protein [Luteimonas sp. BDR2-5]MCD9028361.1 sorbosone dehydrogenase family protein [Luteimonas sp. BDR2-5]
MPDPRRSRILLGLVLSGLSLACTAQAGAAPPLAPSEFGPGTAVAAQLPAPADTSDIEVRPPVVGWPIDRTPVAPEGFSVTRYAEGLDYPRWLHVLANGDVLVAEARSNAKSDQREVLNVSRSHGPSANRITLLRDVDGDGTPDVRKVFAVGLNQPFGMQQLGDWLYVAVTDGVWRFPYADGETRLRQDAGEKILDLPAGGYNNHWTRNVIARPDGRKLYVTVGSASNNGEFGLEVEERRAAILEIDPDGSNERIFASGLRNPNGIDFEPRTGALWTSVNERDLIGDALVPDYITSVQDGGFYGWPYAYFGRNVDERVPARPDLVERTLVPDFAVGAHTSALSLHFPRGDRFPAPWRDGAFVALHGSWNRSELAGYQVIFVPFEDGRPSGEARPFLTGFVRDGAEPEVYGRPTHVIGLGDGSLLLTDDAGDTVWRIAYEGDS